MEAMGIRNGMRATTEVQALGSVQAASRQFSERLATHVTAPSDRTSFLQAVRAHLANKS